MKGSSRCGPSLSKFEHVFGHRFFACGRGQEPRYVVKVLAIQYVVGVICTLFGLWSAIACEEVNSEQRSRLIYDNGDGTSSQNQQPPLYSRPLSQSRSPERRSVQRADQHSVRTVSEVVAQGTESTMDAAWLPSPVMFESSRDFDCEGFEPDQCQYYKESWHNW